MLELVTITVRNLSSQSLIVFIQFSEYKIHGNCREAVTAGKETQRDLLRVADSWDNGFSAFLNTYALRNIGGAEYCRAI